MTLGVYFHDVGDAEGPLACIPGSHKGDLYSHFHPDRTWSGYLSKDDLVKAKPENAVNLTGKAGTIIAINCRTIHGSMDNKTDRVRPLLLYVYSSADAFTWVPNPTPCSQSGEIVRGTAARHVHMEPYAHEVPPNWEKEGYGSIFASQRRENIGEGLLMTPEDVLQHDGRVLTRSQREFYFENGFMAAEDLIPREWTDLVRAWPPTSGSRRAGRRQSPAMSSISRRSTALRKHTCDGSSVLSTIIPFSTVSRWNRRWRISRLILSVRM